MDRGGTEPPEGTGEMGGAGEYLGKGGIVNNNSREVLCGGGTIGAPVWFRDMVSDPPVGEIPQGVSPPGVAADGGYGPETSAIWDVRVTTHWGGDGNCGTGGYWDIYRPPTEHGRTIHCDSPYHVLVS